MTSTQTNIDRASSQSQQIHGVGEWAHSHAIVIFWHVSETNFFDTNMLVTCGAHGASGAIFPRH